MFKPITLALTTALIVPVACQSSDGDGQNSAGSGGTAGTGGAPSHAGVPSSAGGAEVGGAGGDFTGPETGGAQALGGKSAGGTAGSSGSSSGGTSSGGRAGADAGGAGENAGGAGEGGAEAGASCGELGSACCESGNACTTDLACLANRTCSCVQKLVSDYTLRVDGAILQPDGQTPVLDAETALPLRAMTGLSDGRHHGCAFKSGTAWCWSIDSSGNTDGQLGNGTRGTAAAAYRATKVLVSANTPLADVAGLAEWSNDYYSSYDSSCAVTTAGKLYCWGNLTWLVNNGTTLSSPYAQAITSDGLSALTGVVQVSIGAGRSACAVLRSGSAAREVRCWGANYSSNLGQGDTVHRQYPTKVLGLTDPSKVVIADGTGSSYSTACAIDGGQVRCWGDNYYGQTGVNSDAATISAPTLVRLQNNVVLDQIIDLQAGSDRAGYDYPSVCALRSDQTVWCWGTASGFAKYAANYGVTNAVKLSSGGKKPIYLTSDGVYHVGSMATRPIKCGSLE